MACTPSSLVEDSKCFACLSEKQLLAIIAYLSCAGGGGGGGGGQILEYTLADPTTEGLVPDDPTQPAIAYKQDGSTATYVWNTDTQAWN